MHMMSIWFEYFTLLLLLVLQTSSMILFLVLPSMEIKPHCSSNKAFVWNSPADFADEEPSPETLAVKFGSPESE